MSAQKFKTNFRIISQKLQFLCKKKNEMNLKNRKTIADLISENKEDRARIKVEMIIREDFLIDAFEMLDSFCDLLLARIGLIDMQREVPEGLETAISSIVWAAPRIAHELPEALELVRLFTQKYKKEFVAACQKNELNTVSHKIIDKLKAEVPPRHLVEQYMSAIADLYKVPFEPDPEALRPAVFVDGGNAPPAAGWLDTSGAAAGGGVPPPPAANDLISFESGAAASTGGGGAALPAANQMGFPAPPLPPNAHSLMMPNQLTNPHSSSLPGQSQPPETDEKHSAGGVASPAGGGGVFEGDESLKSMPPKYDEATSSLPYPVAPPSSHLPAAPPHSQDPPGEDSVDFDELSKRFEQLKNRK